MKIKNFTLIILLFIANSIFASGVDIVRSLFPNNTVESIDNYFGFGKSKEVITSIVVRNKNAFISIDEILFSEVDSSTRMISFPIYLFSKSYSLNDIIENRAGNDAEKREKLTQLLFVDKKGQVIGKPDGFPLKSSQWTCLGDFCNNISSTELKCLENDSKLCKFAYTKGIDQNFFRLFQVVDKKILTSKDILFGETIDNDGCEVNVSYQFFFVNNQSVNAIKQTLKNTDCSGLQKQQENVLLPLTLCGDV